MLSRGNLWRRGLLSLIVLNFFVRYLLAVRTIFSFHGVEEKYTMRSIYSPVYNGIQQGLSSAHDFEFSSFVAF